MANTQIEALIQQLATDDLAPDARITMLNTLAWLIRRTDLTTAITYTKEAYQLALMENDMLALAVCNGHLARFYYYKAKMQQALNYVNTALALFDEIQIYDTFYQETLHTLATVYKDIGNYKDAFEIFVRLLEIAQDADDLYYQSIAHNGLAGIHSRFENREDALENYEAARAISLHNQDIYMLGVVSRNMAMEYEFLNKHSLALQYAQDALGYFERLENNEQILQIELIMSDIYLNMVDYRQAEHHLYQLWNEITRTEIYRQKFGIETLLKLSKLDIAQNRPDEALIHVQQAHDQALANDKLERICECHEQFAQIYKRQGNFKLALYHFEQFHHHRASLLHHDQLSAIHNFSIMYETERARKEADFYKRLREQDQKHHETILHMKDELLHTASHDLKNPLMTMISYLHLLEGQMVNPDVATQRYLDVIKSQVEQMRRLIVDVLDLAVLETEVPIHNKVTELRHALTTAQEIFRPQVQARQQKFEFIVPDYDIYLAIDDMRLEQILHNLLSNAIKYTPSGGTISIDAHCNGNNSIMIKIKDTGWGIPSEDMPHIFDKFYRSNSVETAQEEGTGLGLAIVKRIIEQYEGTINVQSQVGQGSEFVLQLPLSEDTYASENL